MGVNRRHITAITAGSLLALAYLCKRGILGSFGNTAKICQLFKPGIPGLTIAGGGAIVPIGNDTIQLAALITRLKKSGIGEQSLSAIKPGDAVPGIIYPIGYRGVDIDGNRFEVQGYVIDPIFSPNKQRTLGYQVVTAGGVKRNYSPAMIDQKIKFVTVT